MCLEEEMIEVATGVRSEGLQDDPEDTSRREGPEARRSADWGCWGNECLEYDMINKKMIKFTSVEEPSHRRRQLQVGFFLNNGKAN